MKNDALIRPARSSLSGFTLVELLIGIALGVVVLGSVLAVYIPTIKSWNATASLAQFHDTESLLHDIFGTSIRQAGVLACGHNFSIIDGLGLNSSERAGSANWAFKPLDFLKPSFMAFAADSDVSSTLGSGLQSRRLRNGISGGSRIIGDAFFVLAPGSGFFRVLVHDNANQSLSLSSSLSKNINFKAGDFFIVNDCNNPMLIRASSDASSHFDPSSEKTSISVKYANSLSTDIVHPENTVVNLFEPAIYYLGAQNGVPTLYRATLSSSTPLRLVHTPLLTGVENLRVEYGIADSAGNYVKEYQTLSGPAGTGHSADASLSNVLSVRLSVMMQAPGGDSARSNIAFPNLQGELRYCFRESESSRPGFQDACPEFLKSSAGGMKRHKVIQFTYILPRPGSIQALL